LNRYFDQNRWGISFNDPRCLVAITLGNVTALFYNACHPYLFLLFPQKRGLTGMIPNPLHHPDGAAYGAAFLSYYLSHCWTVCPFILSNRWILSHPPHQGYWLGCPRLLNRG
jgi:hypothetical protein